GGETSGLRGAAITVEAAAVDELQGEERIAVFLADLVDLHDVRMPKARDGLRLQAKAGDLLGSGMRARQDHLQRDGPFELAVDGLVDDPHAAASEFLDDLVLADQSRAGGRRLHGTAGCYRFALPG